MTTSWTLATEQTHAHRERGPWRRRAFVAASLLLAATGALADLPADPEMIVHTPDTTGMPGQENVSFARVAPDGRLWVSSRNLTIWTFGGIGIYDGEKWETYSSRNTPLPVWTYEVDWTSDGIAWVAGEDRLLRFDGMEWNTFDETNSPLVGDRNWDVAVAPNDHIWVANNDIDQVQGGLFEFDGTTWTHHDEPFMRTYFGISAPFAVYARGNGEIWASFEFMGGNARLVNGLWVHTSGPAILDWAETPDGTLYGVCGTGTYRFNDDSGTWTSIGSYTSHTADIDADGNLYIGDDNLLRRYNSGGGWELVATGPSAIHSVAVNAAGEVWLAHNHSARRYAFDGTGLEILSSIMTGIPDYIIDGLHRDSLGNLWFLTGPAGGTRWDGKHEWRNFGQYGHNEAWPFGDWTPAVHQVFEDSQGYTWLVSDGAARSMDLENWDVWHAGNSTLTAGVNCMGEDVNGVWWFGTDYGMQWFDGTTWGEHHFAPPGWTANEVEAMAVGNDGTLWVGTYVALHKYDGATWTQVITLPGKCEEIEIAPNGDVWIATGGGLLRYDGLFTDFYTPGNSGLSENWVTSVAVRDDGLVAAASQDIINWPYDGGVSLFDGSTWTTYGYGESNLPHHQCYDVEFDAAGNLWAAMVNYGGVEIVITDPAGIPGDLDGDGDVDQADLGLLLSCYGSGDCGDIDGDGDTDQADLGALLANYGA